MGRHSPHITPDRLPRHISSETVYTRSDTVLLLPEVQPHKQDVSSDQLNLRYLRGQTQHSRMHRKTKDSDNPTEMQQLQRSAHNGIKSLSCTETKSTSNPEVYPGDASQVRTEDNISTGGTARIHPYNVRLSRCTEKSKEQNTTSRHYAQTNTWTNKEIIRRHHQRQACNNHNTKASSQQANHQNKRTCQQRNSQNGRTSQQIPRNQLNRDTTAVRTSGGHSNTDLRASCNNAYRSNATTDPTVLCQRNKSQESNSSNDSIHSESTEEPGDDALGTDDAGASEGADLPTEFRIVHWNAQGLNSNLHILESTIRNHNLDAMIVHDTRIEEHKNGRPPVKINGYHMFYKPKDNMCHGFITIVRNRFPVEELDTLRPGTHSDLLTVKIWINNQPLLLHNLYRTKKDIDLVKLLDTPTPAFVGTDINAQHLLWSSRSNTAGRRIMKQFKELREYVILNDNQEPTTIYESAIDITILHARLAARSHWEVLNDLVSDHYGIYTAIYLKDKPPKEPQPK